MSTPASFQCRHIFTDGHRCGSPALRNEPFCFYHHTTRSPKPRIEQRDVVSTFDLPVLEDRSSIQAAIGLVLQRIAQGNLDSKRAGLLLYGLQIASSNLPKASPEPARPVQDLTEDVTHGPLAPVHRLLSDQEQEEIWDLEDTQALHAEHSGLLDLQACAPAPTLPAPVPPPAAQSCRAAGYCALPATGKGQPDAAATRPGSYSPAPSSPPPCS